MSTSLADLQRRDREHHFHPFTDFKDLGRRGTRVIVRGEGVYVWDHQGNKLLDGMSGLWNVNVGYGRRELIEAATRQLETLPTADTALPACRYFSVYKQEITQRCSG